MLFFVMYSVYIYRWMHYLMFKPEPHILLFRRPLGACNKTGKTTEFWKPPPTLCNPKCISDTDRNNKIIESASYPYITKIANNVFTTGKSKSV